MRRRVLLIDMDPQGNATAGCGIDKIAIVRGSCEVLLGECAAGDAVCATSTALSVLPTNQDLTSAEVRLLMSGEQREQRLRRALEPIRGDYELILIDCPPALNMLAVNALVAADSVLIPMQCEYYALEGLSDLVQTIRKVRAHLNPRLEIEGLLRTMYDPRNTLAQNVAAELEKHFGDKLYRTVIPRNIRLAEAPSHGIPVLKLELMSKGAQSYLALAGEMLRRMEARGIPSRSQAAAPATEAQAQPESQPQSQSETER
jgi:chromosome partitioning protein